MEEKVAKALEVDDPEAHIRLRLPISLNDITYLVEEVYKGRSIVSGVPTRLVCVRWKRPEGTILRKIGSGAEEQKTSVLRLRDIVCMTKEEAMEHLERVLTGDETVEDVYGPEVAARAEARMAEAAEAEEYRM